MTENIPRDQRPNQALSLPRDNLYNRPARNPEHLLINGRQPNPQPSCTVCTIVRDLVEDYGYTFEKACWVEYDIVKMLYNWWRPSRISEYLYEAHGISIDPRALQRHKKSHIPSPELFYLDHVRRIAEEGMSFEYMETAIEFMVLTIDKTKELMANDSIKPRVTDANKAIEILGKLYTEDQRHREYKLFLEAFAQVLDRRFEDPEVRQNLILELKQTHRELEAASGNGEV